MLCRLVTIVAGIAVACAAAGAALADPADDARTVADRFLARRSTTLRRSGSGTAATRRRRRAPALEPGLRFSLGSGPQAARNLEFTQVVVGSRTKARTLLLYAESDSGTIWGLTAHGFTQTTFRKAGRGVPARAPKTPPPAPSTTTETEQVSYAIVGVTLNDPITATVQVTVSYEKQVVPFQLTMKLEDGQWKVDDLISVFSLIDQPSG